MKKYIAQKHGHSLIKYYAAIVVIKYETFYEFYENMLLEQF